MSTCLCRVLSAVVLYLAIFVAAATEQSTTVVGHWELIEQPYELTIEFKANGAYVALTAMGVMTGRWTIEEDGRIATWAHENRPKQLSDFDLVGDLLLITDSSGQVLTHRRIKLAGQN